MPSRSRRAPRGHVFIDFAILFLTTAAAAAYTQGGLAHRSLPLILFGAFGLALGLSFFIAACLDGLLDLGGRFSTPLFVPPAVLGALLGAVRGFYAHSFAAPLAGFGLGAAVGLLAGFSAGRFPKLEGVLGPFVGEGVLGVFLLYVISPFVLFLYSALVLPFLEHGFADGLKIASVMAAFIAMVVGFFACLDRFPWFQKLVIAAVLFGFFMGLSAFATAMLLSSSHIPEGRLYAILAAEAAVCAALSWALSWRSSDEHHPRF